MADITLENLQHHTQEDDVRRQDTHVVTFPETVLPSAASATHFCQERPTRPEHHGRERGNEGNQKLGKQTCSKTAENQRKRAQQKSTIQKH